MAISFVSGARLFREASETKTTGCPRAFVFRMTNSRLLGFLHAGWNLGTHLLERPGVSTPRSQTKWVSKTPTSHQSELSITTHHSLLITPHSSLLYPPASADRTSSRSPGANR